MAAGGDQQTGCFLAAVEVVIAELLDELFQPRCPGLVEGQAANVSEEPWSIGRDLLFGQQALVGRRLGSARRPCECGQDQGEGETSGHGRLASAIQR